MSACSSLEISAKFTQIGIYTSNTQRDVLFIASYFTDIRQLQNVPSHGANKACVWPYTPKGAKFEARGAAVYQLIGIGS